MHFLARFPALYSTLLGMDPLFPFRWKGIMVYGYDEKRGEIKTLCTICCRIQSPKGKANSCLVCKKKKETQTNKAECQGPRDLSVIDSATRDLTSTQQVCVRSPGLRAPLKFCCCAKLLADLRREPDLH